MCGQDRLIAMFYKRTRSPDGLQAFCIDCGRTHARESYRRNHPPKHTPWTPKKERAFRKRYRERNRERIRERDRRHKAEEFALDPEKVRQRRRAWCDANPDKLRAGWSKHTPIKRARKQRATALPVSAVDIAAKMAYWGNRCWICHGLQQAVDHVKPLSKGGFHCLANLRPICHLCNSRKRDRWPFSTVRKESPWPWFASIPT